MALKDRLEGNTKNSVPAPVPMLSHLLYADVVVLGALTDIPAKQVNPLCLLMEVQWIQEIGLLLAVGQIRSCGDFYQYLARDFRPLNNPIQSTGVLPLVVDAAIREFGGTGNESFKHVEFQDDYFLASRRAHQIQGEFATKIQAKFMEAVEGFHKIDDEKALLKFILLFLTNRKCCLT